MKTKRFWKIRKLAEPLLVGSSKKRQCSTTPPEASAELGACVPAQIIDTEGWLVLQG
jgi:hypothetical protein